MPGRSAAKQSSRTSVPKFVLEKYWQLSVHQDPENRRYWMQWPEGLRQAVFKEKFESMVCRCGQGSKEFHLTSCR